MARGKTVINVNEDGDLQMLDAVPVASINSLRSTSRLRRQPSRASVAAKKLASPKIVQPRNPNINVEVPKRQLCIGDYFKAKPIPATPVKPPSSKYVFDISSDEDEDEILPAPRKGRRSKDQSDDEEFQAPDEDAVEDEDEDEVSDVVSDDEDPSAEEEEDISDDDDRSSKEKKAKSKAAAKIIKNEPFNPLDIPEGQEDFYLENVDKTKPQSQPCGINIKPVPKDDAELPPMSNLENIFHDILNRVPGQLKKFMGPQKYRKLRVATMCSGTESPLLALAMFARDIKASGYGTLEIEHVFSCEIEPYKQAYIERNFKPPILFRDIVELAQDYATTAYGAKVKVPGGVDILIAGTSCVDYSNLNNRAKKITDGGESGNTFFGMLGWAKKHRPAIIIQENVSGAPWAYMRQLYRDNGYSAEFARFDSKQYYIPHTRVRGYLFAVNVEDSKIPNKWLDFVKVMQRNRSTTFEAFMLPDDDPLVQKARQQLSGEHSRDGIKAAKIHAWDKCEGRHQRERESHKINEGRPLTVWQVGGRPKLLDFMWQDWAFGQVERVLDLMDINYLLCAQKGFDAMFKAGFWNLSQNVDRNTMGGDPNGICPCLTPTMIPFLTYRGGPMSGIECLHMQGLPIKELLLTRETTGDIQNLAGNAMTSTVVGVCMLGAIFLSDDILPKPDPDAMELDGKDEDEEVLGHIVGDDDLVQETVDLSSTEALDIKKLLEDAKKSNRLCMCEGRAGITNNRIRLCTECGFTVCHKCGGRPPHVVAKASRDENERPNVDEDDNIVEHPQFKPDARIQPLEFEQTLKNALPMQLILEGINQASLEEIRNKDSTVSGDIKKADWSLWSQLVLDAFGSEFRFKTILRHEIWTVVYEAPKAKLELVLKPERPEWKLFALCPETEGQKSGRRALCGYPLARMLLKDAHDLLAGTWELNLPTTYTCNITVEGQGEVVDGWRKGLGLLDQDSLANLVWDHLKVSVPKEAEKRLDRNISGTYKWLRDCGAAQGSLHILEGSRDTIPLFLFIDQTRIGVGEDAFVFSEDRRRLGFGEVRSNVATLNPEFRQFEDMEPQTPSCTIHGFWVPVAEAKLDRLCESSTAAVRRPGPDGLDISASPESCKAAHTIIRCEIPLERHAESVWPKNSWVEVSKIKEKITYEDLAWLTERIRSMSHLAQWKNVDIPDELSNCESCAPTRPEFNFVKIKGKFVAKEVPEKAAPFERALKNRPAPFVTHLHMDDNALATLRIGLNATTLIHRALGRFPKTTDAGKPRGSWRLVTDYVPDTRILTEEYKLTSNKGDPQHEQPPNFKIPLRNEQLRSLHWMINQESDNAKPFIEEEVVEQLFPYLNWRAEGRIERPHLIRGGVVADQVGYGKTAISIGLIDATQKDIKLPKDVLGAIPIKATLILIPAHLNQQWPDEIAKFTGNTYGKSHQILEIKNAGHLAKLTIKDFQEADIIICTASLFKSNAYLENLRKFSGAVKAITSTGRRFDVWYEKAIKELAEQVEVLKNEGPKAAYRRMEAKFNHYKEMESEQEALNRKVALVIHQGMLAKAEDGEEGSIVGESGEKKRKRTPKSSDGDNSDDDTDDGMAQAMSKKAKIKDDKSDGGKKKLTKEEEAEKEEKKAAVHEKEATLGDRWNLKSSLVGKEWTRMKSPPLQMFHFNRVITDEFSYIAGQVHTAILLLQARSRWILSGTPPLDDFADVKKIARFLNIHLGIDDETEATAENKKSIMTSRTALEAFVAFEDVRSTVWHQRRQQVAQAFLNQFARQNIAEIDEIPWEEHIVPVQLPAAERAIYLELDHHLAALDYNIRSARASKDNDRDRRMQEVLGESKSAEEALLKRCSHFDLNRKDEDNAVIACDHIVAERNEQLDSCREDIRRRLADCVIRYNEISKDAWGDQPGKVRDLWSEFVKFSMDTVGDEDADFDTKILLKEALAKKGEVVKVVFCDDREPKKDLVNPFRGPPTKKQIDEYNTYVAAKMDYEKNKSKGVKAPKDPGDKKKLEFEHVASWPTTILEKAEQLKNRIFRVRTMIKKELCGRHRSLRYFTVVRDLQRLRMNRKTDITAISCLECGKQNLPVSEACVLSTCGHTGCIPCLREAAKHGKCLAPKCQGPTRSLAVVRADSLGSEEKHDGTGRHYGQKLEKVIELIQKRIPKDEKILLFVQFQDLLEKVAGVLDHHKIKYQKITGNAKKQGEVVKKFQEGKDGSRVMLLNTMQESASGANFTNANHVILLSPLLTTSLSEYKACETQAIGRALRYGQQKKVHIWRFLTEETMDVMIFKERTNMKEKDWEHMIYEM